MATLTPAYLPHYVFWRETFSPPELDAIVALGEGRPQEKAKVGLEYGELEHVNRISRVCWLEEDDETAWLHQRIWSLVTAINNGTYSFDISGFSDKLQYAVYHSSERGHFDWHIDQGPKGAYRKISLTLQLSHPSEYEGGDLVFNTGQKIEAAPRERGFLVAFPSYTQHRVMPVTAGVRRSLVIWVTGPKFR